MQEQIPGVLYGPGFPAVALTLSPKELLKGLSTPHRRNVVFSLRVGNDEHFAMVKELQIHPVTRALLHADFYRVDPEGEVAASVPLHTQGKCPGVVAGGVLRTARRELPVRARPELIPVDIVVDISKLEMHGEVCVRDLPLAEGVRVALPDDQKVVWVAAPRRKAEEAAAGEGAPEGEAAAAEAPAGGAAPSESKG
jgi:large subunit ribosomal protein L25